MATNATLNDVIQRLKAEGNLVRNSGKHSIKSIKEIMMEAQGDKLQDKEDAREAGVKQDKQLEILGSINQSLSKAAGSGGKDSAGGGLLGGLGAGMIGLGAGMLKSATGLVALGVAIPAFFGGLAAGNAVLGTSWMESNLNYDNIKKAAMGFQNIVADLDTKTLTVLGGLFAASAAAGIKGKPANTAIAIASMSAGIAGFFGGLALGDKALGTDFLNSNLNYDNIKKAIAGFSDVIGGMDATTATTLGAILAAGTAAGIASTTPGGATKAAIGMASMSAGIVGFFGGLALGEAALGLAPSVGNLENTKAMVTNFGEATKGLDNSARATLITLLGAGGLVGQLKGVGGAAKAAVGMSLIGAGISGFFAGFSLGDVASEYIGDGSETVDMVKNFADAINSLDDKALATLGVLTGAGALAGLFGPASIAGTAVGMTAIGASIAGFFAAFDGVSAVANIVGLDGSNAKLMMQNMAAGLDPLSELDGDNLIKVGTGLGALGLGMAAFFGAKGLGAITNVIGDAYDSTMDFLFGTDEGGSGKKTTIERMVEAIKPLEKVDGSKYAGLKALAENLEPFMKLNFYGASGSIDAFGAAMARSLPVINAAVNGDKLGSGWFDGIPEADFAPGLANMGNQYQKAVDNFRILQSMVGNFGTGGMAESLTSTGSTNAEAVNAYQTQISTSLEKAQAETQSQINSRDRTMNGQASGDVIAPNNSTTVNQNGNTFNVKDQNYNPYNQDSDNYTDWISP